MKLQFNRRPIRCTLAKLALAISLLLGASHSSVGGIWPPDKFFDMGEFIDGDFKILLVASVPAEDCSYLTRPDGTGFLRLSSRKAKIALRQVTDDPSYLNWPTLYEGYGLVECLTTGTPDDCFFDGGHWNFRVNATLVDESGQEYPFFFHDVSMDFNGRGQPIVFDVRFAPLGLGK